MDGKTLGQIAYEVARGKWATWEAEITTCQEKWEAAAQAVITEYERRSADGNG